MPKEPKHIAEAQKQRKKIKDKFSKYVPGRITLQVLGTGAEGAPTSLYVFSDQSRYLFNCGEGTQRLAHEHKMKLAKLEHIFVTQRTWRNIGGLPGTALTIQDVGVPQITLHGPKGLEELFTATKRFVILKDLKVEMAECSERIPFEDNVMKVHYVPITKRCESESVVTNHELVQGDNGRSSSHLRLGDDENSHTKGIQVDYSSTEVSTSTRNEKKSRRRNSRSCSPSIPKIEEVEDDIDYYAHERKPPKLKIPYPIANGRRTNISNLDSSRLMLLKDVKQDGVAMCYVCKLQPRPGTLSLDKCVKYGVPAGPLLGKLKMGNDIILQTGVTVRSTDVCEPDDPGPVFLVVDCPSEDYLDSFVNNPAFKKHQANIKINDNLAYLVVHFTPQRIMDNPRYRQWVDQFSPSTRHLVLNETNTCMGSISVHRVQRKLNLLHDTIFPLLGDNGSKTTSNDNEEVHAIKRLKTDESQKQTNSASLIPTNALETCDSFTYVNTFCNFHLRPRKGLDRSNELVLTPIQYIEETMKEEGFSESLRELQYLIREKAHDLRIQPYPRLLFLGTGSCIPNKTRNTSGILLETSEYSSILIDCGEGTYGQIVRFFGPTKADQILSNIKGIFISHLHADHHIGLIGLLQGRRKALDKLGRSNFHPVLLLAPKQILTWLNFYDKYFENICREFELIPNADLVHEEQTLFEGTKVRVYLTLEMTDITTAYVRHCPNAFGIAFTHKNGYKICYSGDTMPSENLINIGVNCDLLIHEATMEDELEQEAIMKMHSTTSQAIEVGRNMNAKNILLTHFSQRYAKLPRFNDNFGDNVGIAFDNMRIRLDELPLVPLLYPALKIMFAEHYEELEMKAVKRQFRIDRQEEARNSRDSSPASKCNTAASSSSQPSSPSSIWNNERNSRPNSPSFGCNRRSCSQTPSTKGNGKNKYNRGKGR